MTFLHCPSLSLAALAGVAGLFLSAVSAQAQTVAFTNFGPNEPYLINTITGISSYSWPAYDFTAVAGGQLESITTSILWLSGTNAVTLTLYTNENGQPGTALESIYQSDLPSWLSPADKPLTPFFSVKKPELIAGTSYFLQASASGSATYHWCINSIDDKGLKYVAGAAYVEQDALRGAFSVSVSPVPEPSTYAALCGVAALGLVVWRRRAKR